MTAHQKAQLYAIVSWEIELIHEYGMPYPGEVEELTKLEMLKTAIDELP